MDTAEKTMIPVYMLIALTLALCLLRMIAICFNPKICLDRKTFGERLKTLTLSSVVSIAMWATFWLWVVMMAAHRYYTTTEHLTAYQLPCAILLYFFVLVDGGTSEEKKALAIRDTLEGCRQRVARMRTSRPELCKLRKTRQDVDGKVRYSYKTSLSFWYNSWEDHSDQHIPDLDPNTVVVFKTDVSCKDVETEVTFSVSCGEGETETTIPHHIPCLLIVSEDEPLPCWMHLGFMWLAIFFGLGWPWRWAVRSKLRGVALGVVRKRVSIGHNVETVVGGRRVGGVWQELWSDAPSNANAEVSFSHTPFQ